MQFKLRILLVGRSQSDVTEIEAFFRAQSGVQVSTRVHSNGHTDPLYGVDELPDTLVYVVSNQWRAELESLMARPPSERPPIIVVGPAGATDIMRASMRAGARDFLNRPLSREEVDQTLTQIATERAAERSGPTSTLTAVVNGKGGAGATVLASNLACATALQAERRVLLWDLDLRFGSLPTFFNLGSSNGFTKALELVESLDASALEGYVQRTEAGPDLLSSASTPLILPEDVDAWRLESLLTVLAGVYDEIFVDLPRSLDNLSATLLEHADRILIVIQQTIADIRDTRRLIDMLTDDVGLPEERLLVLVNRYDKRGAVGLSDVRSALGGVNLFALPNDYDRVAGSVNAGIPLVQLDRSAPLSRRLFELAEGLKAPLSELHAQPQRWRIFNWKQS
jgi:pilus assembly protein CpaE